MKIILLLNRVFRVGTDQTGQYLDIEPDLRHAPLIISESRCKANTKKKRVHKLVLDGSRSPTLNREDAKTYRPACVRLSYLAQDRLDLAETAKHLAQRMSEPRDFDLVPMKHAPRYTSGEETQSTVAISNSDFEHKNMLTRSQSSWTATLLATQTGGRVRRDLWLRLVTTL